MEKRRFLYYNLKDMDKNKNNLIYKYIIDNKIEHNENNNGLLLNLSIISEEHINELYRLYNLKGNKIDYDLTKFKIIKKEQKKPIIKKYKKYEASRLEKMILSYS